MNSKKCKNCAWFCHADGKCWGNNLNVGLEIYIPAGDGCCRNWTFDGLEDWEREDTLVTMEVTVTEEKA